MQFLRERVFPLSGKKWQRTAKFCELVISSIRIFYSLRRKRVDGKEGMRQWAVGERERERRG